MCNSEYASKQLQKINNRIEHAANTASRDVAEINLIGAAKQQSADLVAAFVNQGLAHVGENYLQEGIQRQLDFNAKQKDSNSITAPVSTVTWHFIGHLQSNKTKAVALHFDWVHGLDKMKTAKRLASHRIEASKQFAGCDTPINVLLQINVDAQASKAGVNIAEVIDLSDQISQLEGVQLRGFMLLPQARQSITEQRAPFAKARELLSRTNQRHGLGLDTLSMGMSNDLEAAILEGATMVRIGTDLFGPRANANG